MPRMAYRTRCPKCLKPLEMYFDTSVNKDLEEVLCPQCKHEGFWLWRKDTCVHVRGTKMKLDLKWEPVVRGTEEDLVDRGKTSNQNCRQTSVPKS